MWNIPDLTWKDMVLFRDTRERKMRRRAWQGMQRPRTTAQGNHVRIAETDGEELKASEDDDFSLQMTDRHPASRWAHCTDAFNFR